MRQLLMCVVLSLALFGDGLSARADGAEIVATDLGGYQAYVHQIAAVEKELGPAASPVFGIILSGPPKSWRALKSFKELERLSSQHPDFCIRFLSEPAQAPNRRAIAMWPMYELGASDYVVFLQKMIGLLDHNLISSAELTWAISPTFADAIVCNYGDRDVQSTLRRILARDDIGPRTESSLRSLLSGAALNARRRLNGDDCNVHR